MINISMARKPDSIGAALYIYDGNTCTLDCGVKQQSRQTNRPSAHVRLHRNRSRNRAIEFDYLDYLSTKLDRKQVQYALPRAEWLERHAGKQVVIGSIPGGGTYFHFEFCAFFPLLTAR